MNTKSVQLSKKTLRFNRNGSFRILCVSDIHGGVGYDEEGTTQYLNALIDNTNPDMILLLGDIAGPGVIHISTPDELRAMLTGLTRHIEEKGIPWAHVFGNHDNNFGVENDVAEKVYEEFPCCVSSAGPDELPGCGNWYIPVLSSDSDKPRFFVWGLDSHRGNDAFRKNYSLDGNDALSFSLGDKWDGNNRGIDFSQVNWYYNTSLALEKEIGRKTAGMMVMHVPVFEMGMLSLFPENRVFDGIDSYDTDVQGFNSGLFRACVERGDIKAMCFGHNHLNSYGADYCGIKLCYDGYLSRHACHKTATLGGRIFDVNENDPFNISTQLVLIKDILDIPEVN